MRNSRAVEQELLRLDAHKALLVDMLRRAVAQDEPSVRRKLLFGSVLKVLRTGQSVRVLSAEAFVEEILALSRTMAEVTINAAYLQDAEDEEIDRFIHFDTQTMFKHSTKLRPHISNQLSVEELRKIEAVAKNARSLTGRRDTDPSWSKRNLLHRAEYSDGITRSKLMTMLVLTAYAYGHSAVHGTFDSMDDFISALDDSKALIEHEREEKLFLALSSVNFVLCTMCFYLNSFFHLDSEKAIISAGKLTVGTSAT